MEKPRPAAGDAFVSQPTVGEILEPPHGLEAILAAFGDVYSYIRTDGSLDPRWQTEFLAPLPLPFPMRLSWDKSRTATRVRCHRRMAGVFSQVFAEIQRQSLQSKITAFGGCFSFRPQRTGAKLSTHAWGIAIDLNPDSNAQGSLGDMDPGLIEIFRSVGFEWGGQWAGAARDPMHFQFCTGY
jgi:hypothetical protein